ncbi:hypothetical protein GCM10025865_15570 [Paraoerskovia sediminicola]|uniref:Transmembrane protein n=1 Tax=Paraoerskovia sediminicola TaxID=1138587 RepID=A0ABM8G2D1_9CELL|nr:hypothetical protein [Paraoerskovia sediminicola]BDZ42258.1 hypothetical protein GCM10025865_15570 [Paraoerskovia sediminicola]
MSKYIELDALVQVVLAGILVGAGLPALFALGVRTLVGRDGSLATGAAAATDSVATRTARPAAWRLVVAGLCFAVIVAAIGAGIWFLASGGH